MNWEGWKPALQHGRSLQASRYCYCCYSWDKCIYDEERCMQKEFPCLESFSSCVCTSRTHGVFIFQLVGLVLDLGHQVPLKYKQMLIILQQECKISFSCTQEMESTACNFQSPHGHSSFLLLQVLNLLSIATISSCLSLQEAVLQISSVQLATWYLSSVSLCALQDETLQLLVSIHTLRF